jgi:hypothetical protein
MALISVRLSSAAKAKVVLRELRVGVEDIRKRPTRGGAMLRLLRSFVVLLMLLGDDPVLRKR